MSLPPDETLHASCVSAGGRGLLILGPSGAGKSALALEMMECGAALVADDRTLVRREGEHLIASCPPALSGLIEARGLGILPASPAGEVRLTLAVDLAQQETQRLPPFRHVLVLGLALNLVHMQQTRHFPAALYHYLRNGRHS